MRICQAGELILTARLKRYSAVATLHFIDLRGVTGSYFLLFLLFTQVLTTW